MFLFKCLSLLPDCEGIHFRDLVLIIVANLLSIILLLSWQEQSSRVRKTWAESQIQCQGKVCGKPRGNSLAKGPVGCSLPSPHPTPHPQGFLLRSISDQAQMDVACACAPGRGPHFSFAFWFLVLCFRRGRGSVFVC